MNTKFAVIFSVVGAALIAMTLAFAPASGRQTSADDGPANPANCCGLQCDPKDCVPCDPQDCDELCGDCGDCDCEDCDCCCCLICCSEEACPLPAAAMSAGAKASSAKSGPKLCGIAGSSSSCCAPSNSKP